MAFGVLIATIGSIALSGVYFMVAADWVGGLLPFGLAALLLALGRSIAKHGPLVGRLPDGMPHYPAGAERPQSVRPLGEDVEEG